jgi:methylated-DNA-[protein]-cysteine S-methyltransferase
MKRYWDIIESPFSNFAAWVDEKGRLVRFNLRATGAAKLDPDAERNPKALAEIRRQVNEYAKGKRKEFDLKLAAEGPDFNKLVWNALCDIPFGTTTSYGAVARTIGFPKAARAVGAANGANPIALIVPCHRVVGSKLLEHEARVVGTRFDLFSSP